MGDEAEKVFRTVWPTTFVRMGLDRPPIKVAGLPPEIRYIPDYLTNTCWVEVQGFGQDCLLKIKFEKMQALMHHDQYHPVYMFVYHRTTKSWASLSMPQLADLCNNADADTYQDGKHYFIIEKGKMEAEWRKVEIV